MSQYSIYGGMTPIQDALRKGWTPERIEGRLTVGFPVCFSKLASAL